MGEKEEEKILEVGATDFTSVSSYDLSGKGEKFRLFFACICICMYLFDVLNEKYMFSIWFCFGTIVRNRCFHG